MKLLSFSLGMIFLLTSQVFAATTLTVVGDWQTINQETNKPSSIIRIWEEDGKYFGKIAKIVEESQGEPERCTACTGELKDAPVLGFPLISDMELVGNGDYAKGTITDPRTGKVYHCKMTVVQEGKALNVRGYLGFSLLGRTTTWYRARGD